MYYILIQLTCQLFLVLQTRIELVIPPYHGGVIPLNYKSLVPLLRFELRELLLLREPTLPKFVHRGKNVARELGIEPRTTESKSVVLPLHHSRTETVNTV